jgi:hypothetical protein
LEERRLGGLGNFGEHQIPSPDIVAAHDEAHRLDLPILPVDLDDVVHTKLYTQFVKIRHIVQSNGARRKLRSTLPDATDAYDFQVQWETTLLRSKGHRKLEAWRVEAMAKQLRAAAEKRKDMVFVVPVMHFARLKRMLETCSDDTGLL